MHVRDASGEWIVPRLPDHHSGVAVALSDDGVAWDAPTLLWTDWCYPNGSVSWEPSLVYDDDDGRSGWLVYGYSDDWGPRIRGRVPHHMAGRRVRFDLSAGLHPRDTSHI